MLHEDSQQLVASTDRSQRLNQVMSQLELDLMEAAQLRQSGQFALQMMSFPIAEGAESSLVAIATCHERTATYQGAPLGTVGGS